MSVTRIAIVDEALARLGIAPMQSEANPQAARLLAIYDDQLRVMLGLKSWTFARAWRQLARLAAAPSPSPWKYQYQQPTDREGALLAVYDSPEGLLTTAFELVGDRLLSNAETIFVRYRTTPAPHLWSGLFRSCLVRLLQAEFALALREDRGLRDSLRTEVLGDPRNPGDAGMIALARSEDARSEPSVMLPLDDGPLIEAHRHGGRGDGYDGRRW